MRLQLYVTWPYTRLLLSDCITRRAVPTYPVKTATRKADVGKKHSVNSYETLKNGVSIGPLFSLSGLMIVSPFLSRSRSILKRYQKPHRSSKWLLSRLAMSCSHFLQEYLNFLATAHSKCSPPWL